MLLTIFIKVNILAAAESQLDRQGYDHEEANPRLLDLAAWWWLEPDRHVRLIRWKPAGPAFAFRFQWFTKRPRFTAGAFVRPCAPGRPAPKPGPRRATA